MKKTSNPFVVEEGRRIYCVVANTVQSPLKTATYRLQTLLRLPDTKTIQQPPGRIAAQAAHAVSRMRVVYTLERLKSTKAINLKNTDCCPPVTTIVLGARDSFELHHVHQLLSETKMFVETFFDTNPEYGEEQVMTAIATEPVYPADVVGILDYLPLWTA